MTNLPISNANILPAGNGGAPLASSQDSAIEQGETPFASLLAQQIDDPAVAAGTENAQIDPLAIAAAEDIVLTQAQGNQPEVKPGMDIVQDPAGAMAALFMQLPARPATAHPEPRGQASRAFTHAADIALEKASPHSRLAREALAQAETISPSAGSRGAKPSDLPKAEFSAQLQQTVARAPVDSRSAGSIDMPEAALTAPLQQTVSAPILAETAALAAPAHALENSVQTASTASILQTATSAVPAADPHKTIATPLTSEHWANDFSQKINWMVSGREQVAELHLNPPDLGPLNVVLKISENQATALFTSPHSAVREAVENAMPKLREMLADNGIMLGNATVSDQSLPDRNTKGFADRDAGMSASLDTPENTGLEPAVSITPMRRHNGMVDTFA